MRDITNEVDYDAIREARTTASVWTTIPELHQNAIANYWDGWPTATESFIYLWDTTVLAINRCV